MNTIELRPELADKLNVEALRRETSLETLVNELLEESLWRARLEKIHQEAQRFQERHAELYALYAGQYVAMKSGDIIDRDTEIVPLYHRIRSKYGDEPILITPVTKDSVPSYRVLSPKRSRAG